jgi:ribosomal protein S18 acetylase RimI-like enzyme
VRALGERFTIAGIGITEHQPAADGPTGTDDAAVLEQLARTLIDVVAGSAPEDVQRIEQHAINAWPAPITQHLDGWLVRHTPGMQRLRSGNTALPLSPNGDGRSVLPGVEAFYGDRGLPAAVQVSPAARHIGLDEHLAARGYRLDAPIHVLTASAGTVARVPQPAVGWTVEVSAAPTTTWMEAFIELDGHHDSREVADQVISKITLPAAYASITADHRIAGIGLVVGGDDQWAGVYCMATHPDHRRQGVAAAILRAGARWAVAHDVAGLYLQVAQSNAAARNLYARAGFTYAYSYHYRLREPRGR